LKNSAWNHQISSGNMQPFWSSRHEETIRRLCANPPSETDPAVLEEAIRYGALSLGWDLWSHFFLKPDGTLLLIGIAMDAGAIETFTDRSHVLWGLVRGSDRHPELKSLLPERPPGARDCECLQRPPKFARAFCPLCGGVQWLAPD